MDIDAIRAALRVTAAPEPAPQPDCLSVPALAPLGPTSALPQPGSLLEALDAFETAVRRSAAAETEATVARRPSTLRASLKGSTAVDRARTHLLAELRLLGELQGQQEPAGRGRLHLCS